MEFVIGILVGGLLYYVFVDRKKPSGTFTIDLSEDACKLDLHEDLNTICSKKTISLNVKTILDDSLN